jgi:endonuclease/exonuclease/phosphatase family metal-dependent hydrolase
MKQIQGIICLLLVGLLTSCQTIEDLEFGTDTTFEVMSWNLEFFPKDGQTTVDYVFDIIEALDVDLIAIQEVDDISAFEQMIENLSSYNGYLESSYFAGLAYIYKPDIIQINDIYEILTTSQYWSPFPRSPMVIDLNYMNERIIVINNHFKCCGDGVLDLLNSDDEEARRNYASNLLKDYIDVNFPNLNVIVLGDLNDELSDVPQNNVFQMILDDDENYLFVDYDIAMGDNSEWSYPTWPSHLDHILITNELFDDFENESSVISTIKIEEYLTGGWGEYEQYISDHRPVALKLTMNLNMEVAELTNTKPHFINYPNPFSSETIFFIKNSNGAKNIEIINTLGHIVFLEKVSIGESFIKWNGEGFPNGIYTARLLSNDNVIATQKIMLNK